MNVNKFTIYINNILKNTFSKGRTPHMNKTLNNRTIIFKQFYEYYISKFMNLNLYSI